jgi:hypothetical protein
VAIGRDHDWSGSRSRWNAGDYKIVGANDHRAFHVAETHLRTPQFGWPQAVAQDADFASGQSRRGGDRLNVWISVHVFLAQQTVGEGHEILPNTP